MKRLIFVKKVRKYCDFHKGEKGKYKRAIHNCSNCGKDMCMKHTLLWRKGWEDSKYQQYFELCPDCDGKVCDVLKPSGDFNEQASSDTG